jgi:hypothetical protein
VVTKEFYSPGSLSPVREALRIVAEDYKSRAKMALYREDPVLWAKERINITLWSMQREIAAAMVVSDRIVVKSCHSIGKTYLAAIIVCWWIDTHPPMETLVVSTAPTANQVNKLLWEYIRVIHRENGLRGDVSEAAEWKSEQRDVIGQGRKPSDTNISAFSGSHAKYLLCVLDEAGGIPDVLWTGMRAITTGAFNRTLAIGNPDDPATEFGRIFLTDQKQWKKFTVSAFDTPNFTGEEVPQVIKDNLITPKWVEEARETWGEDDPRYQSKVLAEFPDMSENTMFPPKLLQQSIENVCVPTDQDRPVFGVDVARFGNDKTTVVMNWGGDLTVVDSWQGLDLVESAERIHNHAMRHGASEVRIDGAGLGAGVVDNLNRISISNYLVFEMVGNAASPDLNKWVNARAFWHDYFRMLLRQNKVSLPDFYGGKERADNDAKILYDELAGIRYKFGLRSALQIESKDEMRRRGFKSPDFSDACMYATAPLSEATDPLAMSGLSIGDVVYDDPMEDSDMTFGEDFVISPW